MKTGRIEISEETKAALERAASLLRNYQVVLTQTQLAMTTAGADAEAVAVGSQSEAVAAAAEDLDVLGVTIDKELERAAGAPMHDWRLTPR